MKKLFYLVLLPLVFGACTKDEKDNNLHGTWRLESVYDKHTNTIKHPPHSGEFIELTIDNDTEFHGKTFHNIFGGGTYTRHNSSSLTFHNYISTLVAEDEFGTALMMVLSSCLFQATSPCEPSNYEIIGDLLKISTPIRYDIILKKS